MFKPKHNVYTAVSAVDKDNTTFSFYISNTDNSDINEKVIVTKYSINQAELVGIKYVLNKFLNNKEQKEIFTTNTYILSMFNKEEDGSWSKTPAKNVEIIEELRDLVSKNIIIVSYGAGDTMERTRWLAKAYQRLKNHPLKDKIKLP